MLFKEIIPGEKLQPYVKCFWILESETDAALEDTLFPSGFMEVAFNKELLYFKKS
ncbi:DUF6597 domain-containing transcriptional factor [Solitalea canadensis]|uniref:DUF6597 domain-containing protein n=1 Tax=Solitalea canadensis (strain ATCC 29591 / DSM 3403 / JCM 21819 / LMG 8368 / NBRC 15130 / NCIMB 12057 / USAM 9D) TaxID=929556 RepID=H8KS86_SOLCM|nr:DUF6597 domain-containing transcriptional factor [Solitalea canadensis]AFD07874.1 hypothetical protein Solca_2849 [Solitalea canadensis DSM 3403]